MDIGFQYSLKDSRSTKNNKEQGSSSKGKQ